MQELNSLVPNTHFEGFAFKDEKPQPKLNLNLLGEGSTVTRETLKEHRKFTPNHTESYKPVPFYDLVEMAEDTLNNLDLKIVQEKHLLAKTRNVQNTVYGERCFSMMEVSGFNGRDDIRTIIGLRQSHDKSFASSMLIGDAPLVCSNLEFNGELTLSRKNTTFILSDLPKMMLQTVETFAESRADNLKRIEMLENTPLNDNYAYVLSCEAMRNKAIPSAKLGQVVEQWHEPEHDAFKDRNAYSLQNAFSNIWRSTPHLTASRSEALRNTFNKYNIGVAA
jgi:hypothetical protein|tara:strand:- start:413 stop:1249 length:837 start_codon:yes stop_codon:yes gene_type:complete